MNPLTQKLLVAFCLATALSTAAQAQFSFFPYISGFSQPVVSPVIENRSSATEAATQPVAKYVHKSHKNMAAH